MIRTAGSTPENLIRDGHRGLLSTFREFASGLDGLEDRLPGKEELRAMIAFLRHGLLPFAHWEDRHQDACAVVAEDTAFEHALLNAEVDALASAVAELERDEGRDGARIARRIQRHVHRTEALLELHIQKAEDRESTFSEPAAEPGGSGEKGGAAVREMDSAEVHRFLLRHEWGLLCTVGDGVPYAVPVSYGFDGRFAYVASGPGRKLRNLEADGSVCLTVAEVEDGDRWSSVVVTGRALPAESLRTRLHGLDSIRRQRSGGSPSVADLARIARATVFRITPEQVTGRARG